MKEIPLSSNYKRWAWGPGMSKVRIKCGTVCRTVPHFPVQTPLNDCLRPGT